MSTEPAVVAQFSNHAGLYAAIIKTGDMYRAVCEACGPVGFATSDDHVADEHALKHLKECKKLPKRSWSATDWTALP